MVHQTGTPQLLTEAPINTSRRHLIIALTFLCASLGLGYQAWGVVSSDYREQIIVSGVLSTVPRPFRVMSGDECVGVFATTLSEDTENSHTRRFSGGGSVRVRLQGRDISIGGSYQLVSNSVNQVILIQANGSTVGFRASATAVSSDEQRGYRSSLTISRDDRSLFAHTIPLPGPLTVSHRQGGYFDLIAPFRSFSREQSSPLSLAHTIVPPRVEEGTCHPTGAIDLDTMVRKMVAPSDTTSLGALKLPSLADFTRLLKVPS